MGQGSNQTFTITPNSGYAVSQVTTDGTNRGAITTYTFSNVQAAHTISATFVALPTYTITASAGAGGVISPSGAVSVIQGNNQTFTITPNAGYAILQVTVDSVNKGAITTYTFSNVTANHTISATFALVPTAAVSGTVRIGGFATENATVSVYSDAACTLLKTTAKTDGSGSYCVVVPQSATYYLKATQSGFAPSAARTVVVATSAMTG
ncbi:MAG: hypothetical protein NT018_08445, partial [Armatimonadetes bacterium]|nr:hypothetical protein [Armatimonadota bacterium]